MDKERIIELAQKGWQLGRMTELWKNDTEYIFIIAVEKKSQIYYVYSQLIENNLAKFYADELETEDDEILKTFSDINDAIIYINGFRENLFYRPVRKLEQANGNCVNPSRFSSAERWFPNRFDEFNISKGKKYFNLENILKYRETIDRTCEK